MKRMQLTAVAAALSVALVGCGAAGTPSAQSQTGAPTQSENSEPADDAIKVEQVSYEVKNGVEDGSRRVLFSYTNNSDYTIVNIELLMIMPEDVEDEELEAAFSDLIDQGFYTVDDLHDIKMDCDSSFAVEPGQTSEGRAATYGIVYATSMEQYELMQPDMLTIQFLHDGEIYEEYYDYRTESYTLSSDTIDADQWGESELSKAIPRPEGALVTQVDDGEDRFSFDVICMTRDDFDAYVEACREAGYTVDVAQTDTTYYADNEDGAHHVDLIYWGESGTLDGYLEPLGAEENVS